MGGNVAHDDDYVIYILSCDSVGTSMGLANHEKNSSDDSLKYHLTLLR